MLEREKSNPPDADRTRRSEDVNDTKNSEALPAARIYFRRAASVSQVNSVREHLNDQAQGPYSIAEHKGWTVVEVTTGADLLSLRETFPRLIDAWQELP